MHQNEDARGGSPAPLNFFLSFWYVCMVCVSGVCVYIYVCVRACAHARTCVLVFMFVQRPEEDFGCPVLLFLSYSLETGSLTEPGARLMASKSQHSSFFLPTPLQCWGCKLM